MSSAPSRAVDKARRNRAIVTARHSQRRRRAPKVRRRPGPGACRMMAELPLKQAAKLAAQITGARDNEAYRERCT